MSWLTALSLRCIKIFYSTFYSKSKSLFRGWNCFADERNYLGGKNTFFSFQEEDKPQKLTHNCSGHESKVTM